MAQWAKTPATKPENLSLIPGTPGGRKAPALASCPLTELLQVSFKEAVISKQASILSEDRIDSADMSHFVSGTT